MFLHITIEDTSHSFSTVTPRRALQTQHLTGSCKLQHITFQPPSPIGPLVVLIFRRSRDQREPGSSP
jgi:hypothetical protein